MGKGQLAYNHVKSCTQVFLCSNVPVPLCHPGLVHFFFIFGSSTKHGKLAEFNKLKGVMDGSILTREGGLLSS